MFSYENWGNLVKTEKMREAEIKLNTTFTNLMFFVTYFHIRPRCHD